MMDQTTPVEATLKQSRTFLDQQADALTSMLGARVGTVAEELRRTGSSLAESEAGGPTGNLVGQGADRLDRIAEYLRGADGERLIADAEQFASRNPVMAAGAAFVIGMSLSRFFKISSHGRRSFR
jgi:hypothetical protein